MKRQFYPNNEPVKYCEDVSELEEWAIVSAPGTIIEFLDADELKVYMVDSTHTAIEL